jgi:hypothetical protein
MLIKASFNISALQYLLTRHFLKSTFKESTKVQAIQEVDTLQSFLSSKKKHIFGFFVTLKRGHLISRRVFPKIKNTQHTCVPGCMGNWNNNFRRYSHSQMIVFKIIGLVETIRNTDSRYKYFEHFPLKDDMDSHVSITFMLAPIYKLIYNLVI